MDTAILNDAVVAGAAAISALAAVLSALAAIRAQNGCPVVEEKKEVLCAPTSDDISLSGHRSGLCC
jgi:hypothetical protein